MSHYSAVSSRDLSQPAGLIARLSIALMGGVLIFAILLGAAATAFDYYYTGKIYPGITAAGLDLSGQHPAEAAALLRQRFDYPERGRILLRDGDKIWLASPAQLGFHLDPQATAMAAYQLGRYDSALARLTSQFKAWYFGTIIPPQFIFDERTAQSYLAGVASQTDLPTIEASLSVSGTDVMVRPGQVGRTLDIHTTVDALRTQLQSLRDGEIPLVIHESPPAILNVDEQAALARQILSAPLTLTLPGAEEEDPGPWTFEPDALALMLTIERVPAPAGDTYQVGLQTDMLRSFLEGLAPQLLRYRENARFIFNDDTRQLEVIQPSVTGRSLAVEATIASINQKLLAGEHEVSLELVITPPVVSDEATAEELGITEQVSVHTSYFYGSSGARIQNIQTASARFHGMLVPPGATFSMAEVLGTISLDEGYAEALIIFGGRTIQGVGGGVCQVSTTLFRTAFLGGYPIVERHPHAYRVGYYEQRPGGGYDAKLAGLDATVFVPMVDFKFTNDTPHWLLMETYVNAGARTLTWKFYSGSDGRTVDWRTTGPQNVVKPPEPLYEEDPSLSKGEVKQVDWEAEGADVTVTRTVMRNGEVYIEDTISTHYLPWRAVFQYGPGTEGMPPGGNQGGRDEDE